MQQGRNVNSDMFLIREDETTDNHRTQHQHGNNDQWKLLLVTETKKSNKKKCAKYLRGVSLLQDNAGPDILLCGWL